MKFLSLLSPLLAQEDPGETAMTNEVHTRIILFSVYAGVILLIAIWAIFIRKSRNKRRRIYRRQPHTWQRTDEDSKTRHRRRRHEHKRHDNHPERPLNPTLASTGGLPPRRPEDAPPPGA